MSNPSATELFANDEQLKGVDKKWANTASDDAVNKAKAALEAKGHKVTVVNTAAEALETLKTTVPKGASVMNSGSTTLRELGYYEYLKTQQDWNDLHTKVFAESDMGKQAEARRQALSADYFVSSVSAVTEDGNLLVCDLTGTRTGGFTHTGKNLVVVAGTNKVVADLAEAHKRQNEYCLAVESARARLVYKVPGSAIMNSVEIRGANPFNSSRVHVVLVKQSLGY